jgi:hypothetical protein
VRRIISLSRTSHHSRLACTNTSLSFSCASRQTISGLLVSRLSGVLASAEHTVWSSKFDTDGLDVSGGQPTEPISGPNQDLADRMGIVMGTSHQEPMARNTPEWDSWGNGEWNFTINADVLEAFWR